MFTAEPDEIWDERSGSRGKWILILTVAAGFLIIGGWFFWPMRPLQLPAGVSQAEYEQAAKEFEAKKRKRPVHSDTIMTLADRAILRKADEDAIRLLKQIPFSDPDNGQGALRLRAQLALNRNFIEEAESGLRSLLVWAEETESADTDECLFAREMLAFIFALELRFDERKQILQLLRKDILLEPLLAAQYHFPSLIPWRSRQQHNRLLELLRVDPGNLKLLVAHSRHLIAEGQTEAARKLLEVIHQQRPENELAIAALAECHFAESRWEELSSVLEEMPSFRVEEPWLLTQMRAEDALNKKEWSTAEKHLRYLISVDASNPATWLGLSKILANTDRESERLAAQKYAMQLSELRIILPNANEKSPDAIRAVSTAAEGLGMKEAAKDFRLLAAKVGGFMPDGGPR